MRLKLATKKPTTASKMPFFNSWKTVITKMAYPADQCESTNLRENDAYCCSVKPCYSRTQQPRNEEEVQQYSCSTSENIRYLDCKWFGGQPSLVMVIIGPVVLILGHFGPFYENLF